MSTTVLNTTTDRIDLESLKREKINLAVFGHGKVGSELIRQIIASKSNIALRRSLELDIFAIANSRTVLLAREIDENWQLQKASEGHPYSIEDVIAFAKSNRLENLIAIDNTASESFVANYPALIENGFNLVSSNKIANTTTQKFYDSIRDLLVQHNKQYLYETNVGAGLPLIDTIRLLHLSGENITRIRGVFSGSLSYIFNTYSESDAAFSEIVLEAVSKGFTEPDPREDLSGNDVGRKLLVLARELDLLNEISDICIENLVPAALQKLSKEEFLQKLHKLDPEFQKKKKELSSKNVLRYVADLHGDLSLDHGAVLDVKLAAVPKHDTLGQLKGSDSIFEIYTESYGKNPIVIQGAGAGAAVTARGVFGDILRLSEKLK